MEDSIHDASTNGDNAIAAVPPADSSSLPSPKPWPLADFFESIWMCLDKGMLSNIAMFIVMVLGWYLQRHCKAREPTDGAKWWVFGMGDDSAEGECDALHKTIASLMLAGGVFGLSGGVTNSLAIHMLFEPVLNLPGTGVISRNFKEIRVTVKDTIMRAFFDGPHVEQFIRSRIAGLQSSIDLGARLTQVLETPQADEILTKALTELSEKPEGWPLLMFGVPPAEITTMVKPFLIAMAPSAAPLLAKMVDVESLMPAEKIRSEIDALMSERLETLTPDRVRALIERVIRKQLGWLVVWGNVVGALIGVCTVLFAGYDYGL